MSNTRRLLRGRALVVAIVLVVAVVVVVAVRAVGGSDSPKGAPGAGSTSTQAGVIITVVGKVNTLLPNGDFVVNDGHTDYTIAVSSAEIVDLNGATVTAELIQVGGSVQITGAVEGSTITAEKVTVPISQEQAPTTT